MPQMHAYDIHKDFHKMRFLHIPKCPVVLSVVNALMNAASKMQKLPSSVNGKRMTLKMRDGYQLKVDWYVPETREKSQHTILYIPGGGFLMSASPYHKRRLVEIVRDTGIQAFMIHYRLAPKYRFPCALYDVIDVKNHLLEHADVFGIHQDRLIVGGDSAGGNLAAALALYLKDGGYNEIKGSMLIYPALDDGTLSPSRKQYVDTPMLRADIFDYISDVYYGKVDPDLYRYAYPLHHTDLSGLAPVFIETAEFDPLHDDGILFCERLKQAGVETTLNETKKTVHGYDIAFKNEIVEESMRKRLAFLNHIIT